MKKFLAILAWVGLILSVVGTIVICAVARIPNSWLVVAGMVFAISLFGMSRRRKAVAIDPEEEEETEEREPWNWPLIIAWSLVALAAIATILIGIFFAWWFLLPLAALFGALIWVRYLLGWSTLWIHIFTAVIAILIILFGVFLIQKTVAVNANVGGDLNVQGNLNVEGSVNAEGDIKGEGNLDVGGDATIAGDAIVEEDLMVGGNAVVNNDLIVNGDSTIKGDQTVEGDQTIKGDQNVEGDVNVGGDINDVPPTTTTPPTTTKPVHTHKYDKKETAPTCTDKGYTTYTCSCGHSYVDNYVDALGHDYKDEVVAPTTTSKGYTKHTCTRCGNTYEDNYTDMLPTPVAPSFTLLESGDGYWVVKFEGMVSSDIVLDSSSKGHVEWLSANTLKVVKTYEGTCYFSLTDNVSGEVIYLF